MLMAGWDAQPRIMLGSCGKEDAAKSQFGKAQTGVDTPGAKA